MVRPNRLCSTLAIAAAATCGGLTTAVGQPSLEIPDRPATTTIGERSRESFRPLSSQRVVRAFDFEERLTADRPIPSGWFRAQHTEDRPRPGYPIWNRAALDFETARQGEGSVRLPLEGGSVALRLAPGAIPVLPDGVYRIRAHATASGLDHARPGMSATFLDSRGEPIAGTGDAIVGPIPSRGEWLEFELLVEASHPEAAFLQVELSGWQPPEYRGFAPLARPIWEEDHRAAIWFDDVTISQVARLELSTTSPANIAVAPDRPAVSILVRDLTGERLAATGIVRDIDGTEVDRVELSIPPGGIDTDWEPEIERFGWYTVEVAVRSGGMPLGQASASLCWLPPVAGRSDRTRELAMRARASSASRPSTFSLSFTEMSDRAWEALPHVVRSLAAGELTLPAIAESATAGSAADRDGPQMRRTRRINAVIEQLNEDWRSIVLAVDRLPRSVAQLAGLDSDAVVEGLLEEDAAWEWAVDPLLESLGQRVARWQLGPAGDTALASSPTLPAIADLAMQRFGELVPGPMVGLGWSAEQELDDSALGSVPRVVVRVPSDHGPAGAAAFIERHADELASSRRLATMVLDPLDGEDYAPRTIIDDLARRVGLAWEAASVLTPGSVSLQLEDPLVRSRSSGRFLSPTPSAGAWRVLSEQLGARQVVARMPAPDGVTALLLAPVYDTIASGSIMAWNDHVGTSAPLTAMLSREAVRVVDIFGNASIVEPSAGASGDSTHRIEIGSTPVFIEGVDLPLALFQASVSLEPSLIETTSRTLERELVIVNPWPTPISGNWFLAEPAAGSRGGSSWGVSPRSGSLDVPAGEELRVPLEIVVSPLHEAGPIDFAIDAFVAADSEYGRVRAIAKAEVGLDDLDLRLIATPTPGPDGPSVLLEAAITNRADITRELEVVVFASPQDERYRSTITGLASGAVALRRFAYPNARERLRGSRIFVSVLDLETGARLNKSLRID